MHTYLILMYLHRETYLSNITWLFICFVSRGMECILVFVNLVGREHSTGVRGEERGFKPPKSLAGGGDRSRRGTVTFCLFLSPPVTNPNWEKSKCGIECHILGHTI